jgi:hypothetical protein
VDLQKHEIELGKRLTMQWREKAYVSSKTFVESIKPVFLPYFATIRSQRNIKQKEAMVLQWITKGCHANRERWPYVTVFQISNCSILDAAEDWTNPSGTPRVSSLFQRHDGPGKPALLRSCEWQAFTSRNNQVVFFSEFGEIDTASRLITDS